MYTSPNLGLTIWDLTKDDFDHGQLQNNWLALDVHDHSEERGVQIGTNGILPLAITQALIAPEAVGSGQLQDGAVGTGQLRDASVTHAKLAPGAIQDDDIANGTITGDKLDPTVIPLGSTQLWYRPPGSNATPGGWWEACDGRNWGAIDNAWGLTSGHIPDTRNIFIKGADLAGIDGPAIGASGGTAALSLTHSHNVAAHVHGLTAHSHPIGTDGSHFHLWFGGHNFYTRQNAFIQGLTFADIHGTQRQNFGISGMIGPPAPEPGNIYGYLADLDSDGKIVTNMDNDGDHNHGGNTGASGAGSTGSAGSTTDTRLSSVPVDPPWVGFLLIMRVR